MERILYKLIALSMLAMCCTVHGQSSCANPTIVTCGTTLTNESTIGQGDNMDYDGSCVALNPNNGEDMVYAITPAAGVSEISITLDNVNITAGFPFANYIETYISTSANCATTCFQHTQFTENGTVNGGTSNIASFSLGVMADGATTWYIVIDEQLTGGNLQSYDITFDCTVGGVYLDTDGCGGDAGTSSVDGHNEYWNGVLDNAISINSCGESGTVCTQFWIENPGWEWVDQIEITLGPCWDGASIANPTPTTGSWYEGGDWAVAVNGGTSTISWDFTSGGGSGAWGDGATNNQNCLEYSFCFDATVLPSCSDPNDLNFTITVTDDGVGASGATVASFFQYNTNFSLTPSPIISGNIPLCVGQDVLLSGTGTPDPTTPWSSSDPSVAMIDITGLVTGVSPGVTTITYTDNTGCQTTTVLGVVPSPILTVQDTTTCAPNTVDLTDATYWSTDVGTITYFESDGITVVADETAVGAGTYILSVDNAGCITTAPVVVTVSPLPVLTVQDTTTCSPNTIDLTDVTYWSTNVGTITYFESDGITVVADETAVGSGTYILSADNGGCIATAPVVVTVNTTPTLTVQDTTTCSPNTIDLTDATYWSTDVGTITYFESDGTTVVADETAVGSGTYVLSANNLGCITTANVTVTVNALPVIAAVGSDPLTCNAFDGNIEVTLSSGPTSLGVLDWTGTASGTNGAADVTVDSPDINALGAGSYNVTFTDANGCVSNTELVVLTNPGAPIIDPIASIVSCADYDLVLANVTGTNLNTTGALTFYTLTGGPLAPGQTVINDQTFTAFTNTTIFVYDESGVCSAEIQFDITINTTPTLTVQDTTTCSPNTIDLTDATYWSTDVGTITYFESDGTTVVPDETIVGTGTYILSADNLGCIAVANATVTINTTPTLTLADPATVCSPLTVDITTGAVSSTDVGTMLYYSDAGMTILVPDATAVGAGTYYVEATNLGCTSNGSVTVTVNTTPTLTLADPALVCSPATVDITVGAVSSTDVGTMLYYSDAGMTILVPDATVVGAGTYFIEAANLGCTANGSVTVIVVTTPDVDPQAAVDVCDSYTLPGITGTALSGAQNYYDATGGPTVANIVPGPVTSSTTLFIYDGASGCSDEETLIITINHCDITVPTAFTPNGDGMNDNWEILDLDLTYPNNIVYVYNRWGNLLFTSEQGSYDARRWDGTYKEELLPIGSYYFIIEFNDKENETATGIVSIILNK